MSNNWYALSSQALGDRFGSVFGRGAQAGSLPLHVHEEGDDNPHHHGHLVRRLRVRIVLHPVHCGWCQSHQPAQLPSIRAKAAEWITASENELKGVVKTELYD